MLQQHSETLSQKITTIKIALFSLRLSFRIKNGIIESRHKIIGLNPVKMLAHQMYIALYSKA